MKRFTLIVLSVILAAAMLASCTQYRVIWIPGMDDQNTPSTSQSAKDAFSLIDALDAQLPGHIESVMKGDPVPGLTRTDSASTISMASRSGEDSYSATFSFNEYPVTGYGIIKTGTLTVTFTGTKTSNSSGESFSATTSKMDFNNLSVMKTSETVATPVEIKNLEGASKAVINTDSSGKVTSTNGISDSLSIKQSISSSTTITVDNVNVPAKDVADSNTSGDFASGLGTKDFPYVIRSEEQFANIKNYSEEMKNGAYYYFSIESDLDYSTGNIDPYIDYFRGELDFNNHKLDGLSFERITELHDPEGFKEGKWTTGLIRNCDRGAIRNLEYRPVGQCDLVLYVGKDNSNIDAREFTFENIIVGDKDNPLTFKVGNNGGSFISIAYGPNTKLNFRNCTNYCNMNVLTSKNQNVGIFINGYAQNQVEVTFENCDNYGTFQGENLGYLIGNDAGATSGYKSITAKDCNNYGAIYATGACGFIGLDDSKYQSIFKDLGGNEKGEIVLLETLKASVSTDPSTKTISITNFDAAKYAQYEIAASGYASLMDGSINRGTQVVSVRTEKQNASGIESLTFKKLAFIDKEYITGDVTEDEYGNEIATLNGEEYYVIDLSRFDKNSYNAEFNNDTHTLTSVTYSLYAYDNEGKLAGSMTF